MGRKRKCKHSDRKVYIYWYGIKTICKECQRKYNREWKKQHPRYQLELQGYWPGQAGDPNRLAYLMYWQLRSMIKRENV